MEGGKPEMVLWRTIVAGAAGFFGATGILAGIGFLVHQALFRLIGLPSPPFSTIDYLRSSGLFLFDLTVLVLLVYAAYAAVCTVLLGLLVASIIAIGSQLLPLRVRTLAREKLRRLWRKLTALYLWAMHSRAALSLCMFGLVVFTFYYHYPVFAQQHITSPAQSCGSEIRPPQSLGPTRLIWRMIDCRGSDLRQVVLSQSNLAEGQAIYSNSVLWLVLITLYVANHSYSLLSRARTDVSADRRWLWNITSMLTMLSLIYLPTGYGVLFLDKRAPVVHVTFNSEKTSHSTTGLAQGGLESAATTVPERSQAQTKDLGTWQEKVAARGWHLLFQNEKELWLFGNSTTIILQKDHLGKVELRYPQWIFDTP